jgi:signal peptidase I
MDSVHSFDPAPEAAPPSMTGPMLTVIGDPLPVIPTIDVPIHQLTVFERPNLTLDQFLPFPVPEATDKGKIREWSESLVGTIIFVLIFTSFVAQATQVPTGSMKPTIFVGDHFFLDKIAFPGNYPASIRPYLPKRTIHHLDIIAFKSPTDKNIPFVKRVIGLPGDEIKIVNKNVYVNGQRLSEPYKIHTDSGVYGTDTFTPQEFSTRDNYGPTVVPPDNFFVMGDNRDDSSDSRFWGFVDRNSIIGKPLFVYWSYEADPYVGTEPTFKEWIQSYTSIAMHFFDRTRWFRIGTMVE